MENYPSKVLEAAVEEISQLPGIGKRTALRLALHLLKVPVSKVDRLSDSLRKMAHEINFCEECFSLSDSEICEICANPVRDKKQICVVEDIRDVMAIEETGEFRGVYHVLGGKISPMEGIGPSDVRLSELISRVDENTKEIIFALSSTMEGDTTMFYIHKQLEGYPIQFTTIARGIGIGEELQYTDEVTLARSFENRVPYGK